METKISVIIPIYNVEPYIRQCLDSVIGQTYRNLEIILIDDGSPDNCGKICDEYAIRDSRVVVIHKKNAGLSAGWNDGIHKAVGEWLMFVDSDDWLEPSFIADLVYASDLERMQVVTCTDYLEERENSTTLINAFERPISCDGGEVKEQMMLSTYRPFHKRFAAVWNRLYLKRFLIEENILFDSVIPSGLNNDTVFNLEVFKKASNVQVVLCCGYHYRIQSEAATWRFRMNRAKLMVHTFKAMRNVLADYQSQILDKMLDARIMEDIIANFHRDYFHPENQEAYQIVAQRIKEMKSTEPYKYVIFETGNRYIPTRAVIWKCMLRCPWIWPLKVLYGVYEKIKKFF